MVRGPAAIYADRRSVCVNYQAGVAVNSSTPVHIYCNCICGRTPPLVKAFQFADHTLFPNVTYVQRAPNEIFYNILMDTHEHILVSGLICETLNPSNRIVACYRNMATMTEIEKVQAVKNENAMQKFAKHCANLAIK